MKSFQTFYISTQVQSRNIRGIIVNASNCLTASDVPELPEVTECVMESDDILL